MHLIKISFGRKEIPSNCDEGGSVMQQKFGHGFYLVLVNAV
jgi:hypothetical protein